jgi:predicted N-acetyltransferase YhbS
MGINSIDRFVYLADQPALLPILADWFYDEWGHLDSQSSMESMEHELSGCLNKDRLPLTIVRMRDDQPIASASLRLKEMETHPQYLHWLGGVYVHPDFRRQGVGSQLVEFTADQAIRLQVTELYLYTRGNEIFYSRLGWHTIEQPLYQGRVVSLMKRNLPRGR